MNTRIAAVLVGTVWAGLAGAPALGQATTEPSAKVESAYQPPRERDAAGNVLGPGRAGWWNDAVFYQVFVRSFADSREGVLANDGVGDLAGLIGKLDYLNDGDPKTRTDLGITGLWLMPIMESPSYHGYDVVDYLAVERDYGSGADFQRLMKECHGRGIRVILDLVLNHCSHKHPWFVEAAADPASDKRAWFIFADEDPKYKGPWSQNVWHRVKGGGGGGGEKRGYYYGLFGPHMPDLNFRSGVGSAAMVGLTDHWLRGGGVGGEGAIGVDGFRLDAIRHLIEDGPRQDNTPATHEWLKEFRGAYKAMNPEAMCIGEVWAPTEVAASYVGDQLDMCFEFELAQAMVDSVKAGDAGKVRAAQEKVLRHYPPNQYGRFLTNHDQPRVLTQLKGDEGAMRAAAVMLLTGPGVPFIYYGEEIGMVGDKPDPDIRTPMQWGPGPNAGFAAEGAEPWRAVNAGFEKVNVDTQAGEPGSLLGLYRELIALRAAHPALSRGSYTPVETGNKAVYAFAREEAGGAAVVVVVNLGASAVKEYGLTVAQSGLRGGVNARALLPAAAEPAPVRIDGRGGFEAWKPLAELGPRAVCIIELRAR